MSKGKEQNERARKEIKKLKPSWGQGVIKKVVERITEKPKAPKKETPKKSFLDKVMELSKE